MKSLLVIFVFIRLKIWEVVKFFGMGIINFFVKLPKLWKWLLSPRADQVVMVHLLVMVWIITIGLLTVKINESEFIAYIIVLLLLFGLCFVACLIIDILKLYISDIKKFVAGNWRQAQQIVDIKIYKENEKNGRI